MLYIAAICHFAGFTLNTITGMNLNFALGISIDYSAHIAHKYMLVAPNESMKTNKEKREHKVRLAISQMGSSVFHGGFSTFLAICILALG